MLRTDRSGFALPMTLLVIGFLTASVMAAFARAGSEARVVDDQRAEQLAYSFASAGLEQHIATPGPILAADSTTGRPYTFAGGSATVRVRMVQRAASLTDTATYLITSRGRTTASGVGRPAATRTVSMLVYRVNSTMPVLSSWTSLTGLHKNGNAGNINGADHGTCPDKAGNTVAGAMMPTGTFSGQDNAFAGDPPIDQSKTQSQLMNDVGIDWHAFTDPSNANYPKIDPHYIHCPNTTSPNYIAGLGPCGALPNYAQFQNWPVTLINGDYPQDVDGTGILIVTGDLVVSGNSKWRGIILVGGVLTDNGISDIEGAVVSGLNVLKGQTVGQSSLGNGTKFYKYNSCAIAQATSSAARMTSMRNTLIDSWWGM
jgi:hypothetical protein